MKARTLHYSKSVHYPQLILAREWKDPEEVMSEVIWYEKVSNKFDSEPVMSEPFLLPYNYNPRCKHLKNYGLFSLELGFTAKLVLDPEFYEVMNQGLKLGPHKVFKNTFNFKNQKFDVYQIYFMNGMTDFILFDRSKFKYLENGASKHKTFSGSKSDIIDIRTKLKSGILKYEEFYLDEVCLSKPFDIFVLTPFWSPLFLSPRAIEFFSDYNVLTSEIWDGDHPTKITFKKN